MALFYFGIVIVLQSVFAVDGTITDGPAVLVALGLPVTVWCMLMLVWKRIQDIGFPGWVSLIAIGGSVVLAPLGGFAPIALIFLAMWRGEAKMNAFGPPPVPRNDKPVDTRSPKLRLRERMAEKTRERDKREAKEKVERERNPRLGRQGRGK
ncbi:conserved hypothetical protein [Ahrensia sp. R2A130]|nr:conserved hypothetical protein [Ahrensia sp. R2A130]